MIARSTAHEALGDYQKQIDDCREALRLRPNYAIAYYNIGIAYEHLTQYRTAITNYDEAIRLDPKFSWAFNNRGNAYDALGEHTRAIANYTSAIRVQSTNYIAYFNRANVYKRLGDCRNSIADYARYTKFVPYDPDGPTMWSWMLATCPDAKYRDGRKAVRIALRSVQLNNRSPRTHDSLAAAFAEVGKWEDAVREATLALNLWRSIPDLESGIIDRAQQRLALYLQRMPYRDMLAEKARS